MASTLDVLARLKSDVMGLLDEARARKPAVFDPARSGNLLAYEAVLIVIDEAMTAETLAE